MICEVCKEEKSVDDFLKFKDKTIKPVCKDCLYSNLNDEDINTILPLMEEFDIPYIKNAWQRLLNNKKPNVSSIFGKYLALMKLCTYRGYTYKDTDMLNSLERD